ncbi:MAG: tetratricopeptide repeat protein, partial [Nitrospirota bacterium]|nr:tetratricopeptide repeat protein [Nitrospirota bacterium]
MIKRFNAMILGCRATLIILGILSGFMAGNVSWAQESEADVVTAQAILAYDDKKYEEALEFLNHALGISPNHSEALYYAGLVMLAQGKYEESLPFLIRASRAAPDSISILFQLGVAYFSLEQYDKADPLLTRVFQERPATNNVG